MRTAPGRVLARKLEARRVPDGGINLPLGVGSHRSHLETHRRVRRFIPEGCGARVWIRVPDMKSSCSR
jgi:hypothetical protein